MMLFRRASLERHTCFPDSCGLGIQDGVSWVVWLQMSQKIIARILTGPKVCHRAGFLSWMAHTHGCWLRLQFLTSCLQEASCLLTWGLSIGSHMCLHSMEAGSLQSKWCMREAEGTACLSWTSHTSSLLPCSALGVGYMKDRAIRLHLKGDIQRKSLHVFYS